jgi:DNA-binding IclR family transcriptional regulator
MDTAQTVAKAMGLLELLSRNSNLTAPRIISETGMHKSTAYRLLGTLTQLGYIRKDGHTGLYSLSPKILSLASAVTETRDITEIARPWLEEIHHKTGEAVHMAVLDKDELVYLDKIESTRSLRVVMSSRPGSHAPLYCTGIGKILLSGMSDHRFREYLKTLKFSEYTENTITDAAALLAEIDKIREQGYAEDNEEHEEGVYCIAAPVKGPDGSITAAFSVSIPSVRKAEALNNRLIDDVKRASENISRAAG